MKNLEKGLFWSLSWQFIHMKYLSMKLNIYVKEKAILPDRILVYKIMEQLFSTSIQITEVLTNGNMYTE